MNVSGSPSRTVSTSPAPGRPAQTRGDKRGRDSSGSSSEITPKVPRKEGVGSGDENVEIVAKDFNEALKVADLVTEKSNVSPLKDGEGLNKRPDHGKVMSITGTPVKPTPLSVDSPVFKKQGKSTLTIYIAINKRNCLLCKHFLQVYQTISW